MGLNVVKQGSQMYQFINATFNTVKGECPHGCTYCYMKRWGKQNRVRFDTRELNTDLGSGNFIFVGSSCDMFAKEIPDTWIRNTINHCNKYNNTYLFQSKNPQRFLYTDFPLNKTKLCTTIETNRWYPEFMENAPIPANRAIGLSGYEGDKYVTIEPIMDFDLTAMVILVKACNPVQVNIGADSGNNHLPEPPKEKLLELIEELKKFTTIDQKRNLSRLLQ